MSLLLLKKKIQEKIDIIGNPSFGSENYHVKESYARVLRWIDELEKEETSQYHECDHDGPFLLRGWSGRSEKEIRERLIVLEKSILSDGITPFNESWKVERKTLNWVLSKEKDY